MSQTITINFIPCNPTPAQGYKLTWRKAGTADPYTDEGFFTESPIIFSDPAGIEGDCYEGFLQSDCSESGESGSIVGNAIPWSTPCDEESGVTYEIALANPCTPGNPVSNYMITGGTPGDVVKVRASFSGVFAKSAGLFIRADLGISAPNGVSDPIQSSACYADTGFHGFSITADTEITMISDTNLVTLSAVVYNGDESTSSVLLTIIEINGSPANISVVGCKGNSSAEGTC